MLRWLLARDSEVGVFGPSKFGAELLTLLGEKVKLRADLAAADSLLEFGLQS